MRPVFAQAKLPKRFPAADSGHSALPASAGCANSEHDPPGALALPPAIAIPLRVPAQQKSRWVIHPTSFVGPPGPAPVGLGRGAGAGLLTATIASLPSSG